jgi:hypothetical protein
VRIRRADAAAAALLVALPVLVFGVPAMLGHPVLPGDDLTQNFPLRVLAGRELRAGHLPLYNPYLWGGAPLLAGWNAGAAYPLTFAFAVLPPAAAWTINMIVTWAAAGLGLYCFLRALRLTSLPALLGALSFAFAGAMSAQVAHFGLVAGLSWVPWQLLAVAKLTEARAAAERLPWAGALAGAFGLTILAGEPRAIADAAVVVVIYAAWRLARGRRRGPAALGIAGGLLLGVCLGAIQWLPGLAVIGTSQRGASSVVLFNSGSLPHRWLLLMLVPDLLGGSGSLGQPGFFANYNLAEVTGYVGVLPLVAAFALLGRYRLRARIDEWAVWHFIALVGLVLALGGNTPAGPLLARLPLFGGLRLQSRNILVTDLALAVLLAYWAGQPARRRREIVLGVLPPLAMIAVVVLAVTTGPGLYHWLRAGPGDGAAARLWPWLVPYAVLGAAAIAFVIAGQRLAARRRGRWLGAIAAADLIAFTVLAVVAVPGPGPDHQRAARHADTVAGRRPFDNSGTVAGAPARPRPIASLGYRGRFAIYDPGQLAAGELPVLGAPDLNVITGTPSVQGYTSLVDGSYAAATGSHQAMGEGQDVLAPRAAGDGTLDQLGTSVLLTPPGYLVTAPPGTGGATGPAGTGGATSPAGTSPGSAGTGRREAAAGQRITWYLGQPLSVRAVTIPDARARQDAAGGTRLGVATAAGPIRWLRARAAGPGRLAVRFGQPVTGVAVTLRAGRAAAHAGPPSVTGPDGRTVANGQLQDALVPPRWGYAGRDGSFAVFVNHLARAPLTLAPLPGRGAAPGVAGASVRRVAGPADGPSAAAVTSPHGVVVVRAVTAIAGWRATWHPARGSPARLSVRRAGLVQAVRVPPGQGVVTWSYQPPGVTAGLALSLGGLAVLVLVLAAGLLGHNRHGPAAGPDQPDGERADQPVAGLGGGPDHHGVGVHLVGDPAELGERIPVHGQEGG